MIWPPWNWLFGLPGTVPLAADGRDLDNYAIWTTTCPTLRSDWDQAGRGDVRPQGARAVDGDGGPRRSRCHGGRSLGVGDNWTWRPVRLRAETDAYSARVEDRRDLPSRYRVLGARPGRRHC